MDTLKEFGSRYLAKDVNTKIDNLNEKLSEMLKTREKINEDEELLGGQATEFPRLTEGKNNLDPYKELWSLAHKYEINVLSWTKEVSLFKLDPEYVEKETKVMFQTAMKLNFQLNP